MSAHIIESHSTSFFTMVDTCEKSKEEEKPTFKLAAAELEAVLSASSFLTRPESSDDEGVLGSEVTVPGSFCRHGESPGRRRHFRGSSREAMSQKSLFDDECDSVATGESPGETFTLIANIGDMTFESYEAGSSRSVGSPRSRKSRLSRKSMRCSRKRGNSLERDVSLLILQTAAGGAESAHFLVKPKRATPIKSAEDILSDLFVSQDTSLETFSLDKEDGNVEFPNLFSVEATIEPETTADQSMSTMKPSPSIPGEGDTSTSPGRTGNYVLVSNRETSGGSSVISETFTDDSLFAFSDVLEWPPKTGDKALYPEEAQDLIQSKWTLNDAPKESARSSTKEVEGSTLEAKSVLTSLTLEASSVLIEKAVSATGNKPSLPGPSPSCSPDRSSYRSTWTPNDVPKGIATTSTREAEGAYSVLTSSTIEATSVLTDKAVFAAGNKPSLPGRSLLNLSPNRVPDRARHRISASDGTSEVQFALSFVSSSTANEGVLPMVLRACSTIEGADTSIGRASSTPDVEENLSALEKEEIFLDRLVNIVATAQKERPANIDISHYFGSEDENEPNASGGSDDDEDDAEPKWTEFDTSPFTNLDNMTKASGSTPPAPHGDKPSPDSPTSITDVSKISDFSSSSSIREAAKAVWSGYNTNTDDLVSI
jgi:hypothetical protein